MDRDGKNRFDLLEELENELKISLHPMTWPINSGKKEEQEKMKQRRDKRQAELTVEYLRNEEEQDRLFPS